MRGKWLLFGGLAVVAGVCAAAFSSRFHKAPPPAPRAAAAVLSTHEMTLPGTIRAQHVTNVGATVEGNIEAFLANVGDEVFEGQTLARVGSAGLENSREQASAALELAQQQVAAAELAVNNAKMESSRADADLARSRAQMDAAQKIFARQTTLHNAGATPRLKYEASVRDYEAALKDFEVMDKAARAAHDGQRAAEERLAAAKKEAADKNDDLEAAQGAFAAAEVRTPVAGLIVGRKGDVGKPAGDVGDQMFQIATDLFALEAVAEPDPEQLKRVHPGQQALVLVLDLQSTGMPGIVKEVKDSQAIIEFNSALPAIRPGMRADVRLKLD